MSPDELIAELRSRGAILSVQCGRIRVDAPRLAVPPDLRAEMAAHKADLLRLLGRDSVDALGLQPQRSDAQHGVCGDNVYETPTSASRNEGFVDVDSVDATKRVVRPPFHYTDGPLNFGDVCAGWTPQSWKRELRRKADRCEGYRPDIAEYYRDWADDIERRLEAGT